MLLQSQCNTDIPDILSFYIPDILYFLFDNLHFHIYLPQVCPIRLLRFFTLNLLLLTTSFTFKINTSRRVQLAMTLSYTIANHQYMNI